MTKNVLSSVLPLLTVIILLIFVGTYGIGRIRDLRAKISTVQEETRILTEKLNTLRSVNDVALTGSRTVSNALPAKNSTIVVLGQIKSLASQNQVTISNLKSGSGTGEGAGISRADINFELSGSRQGIFSFLAGIEKSSPIALIDRVKLNEIGTEAHATIIVKTYWADLPTKIPTITENISDLTPDEKALLTKIGSLTQPQFVEVAPSSNAGKSNPFAQ